MITLLCKKTKKNMKCIKKIEAHLVFHGFFLLMSFEVVDEVWAYCYNFLGL